MEMPRIETYMTPLPLTLSEDATIRQADECMTNASIRHLPVVNAQGQVTGVVTDREIEVGLLFPGPGELLLKDIVARPPYVVRPEMPLDDVIFEMMEHKYSCALVSDDGGKPVGIFTEIDALGAFRELLADVYTGRAPSVA